MSDSPFWTYWYFQVPNYLAAVIMYTLIGRFLLSLLIPLDSPNYILRFFRMLTDWAVAAARAITPAHVPMLFLPLVAAFWLFLLRHGLFVVLSRAGVMTGATGS